MNNLIAWMMYHFLNTCLGSSLILLVANFLDRVISLEKISRWAHLLYIHIFVFWFVAESLVDILFEKPCYMEFIPRSIYDGTTSLWLEGITVADGFGKALFVYLFWIWIIGGAIRFIWRQNKIHEVIDVIIAKKMDGIRVLLVVVGLFLLVYFSFYYLLDILGNEWNFFSLIELVLCGSLYLLFEESVCFALSKLRICVGSTEKDQSMIKDIFWINPIIVILFS